ncbi:MAG: gamma-glutamylcyclotransferase [Elainella sp.]
MQPVTPSFRVFVYGTLKPGEVNYHYCQSEVLAAQPAFVRGQLYALPFGYPALTVGSNRVYGVVFSFINSAVLTALDQLEDYYPARPHQSEYLRVKTAAFSLDGQSLGSVWVYQMTRQQVVTSGGVLLPQGEWSGRPG